MTTAYLNLFECVSCGATNMKPEEVSRCIFPGSQEEPPEYEDRCPDCNSNDVHELETYFCDHCDLDMPGPDMTCIECQLEEAIGEAA